jgi:methylated-DNA-protein-cysteine methyltransferase related protein
MTDCIMEIMTVEREMPLFETIYAIVRQVPRGKVTTYGQVSRIAGRCSAQMVGFALSALRSREEEDVPWQRVINSKGEISAHGIGLGSVIQRQLLEEEDIQFDIEGRVDLNVYGWDGVLIHPIRSHTDLI